MKKFLFKVLALIVGISIILIYGAALNEVLIKIIGSDDRYKESLLINISTVNMIFLWGLPVVLIILVILYFKLKEVSSGTKMVTVYSGLTQFGQMEKRQGSKRYNVTFVILIVLTILGLIYFSNDYTVIYRDRIEKHNILTFSNASYKYDEIKGASVGVHGTRHGDLYYKVTFNDGFNINLSATNFSNTNKLDGMVQVNDIIKKHNIKRNIDKRYFNRVIDGLGEEYVKKYEDLFRD